MSACSTLVVVTVTGIASPSSVSTPRVPIIVLGALLGISVSLVISLCALYRYIRIRRRRRSVFRGYGQQPTSRDVEILVSASPVERKVDVQVHNYHLSSRYDDQANRGHRLGASVRDLADIFEIQDHDGAGPNLPKSTRNHDDTQTADVDIGRYENRQSADATPSLKSCTPATSTVAFASPAISYSSVNATSQMKGYKFGPQWFYSPKRTREASIQHASPASSSRSLHSTKNALINATWKGPLLSALLEGNSSNQTV